MIASLFLIICAFIGCVFGFVGCDDVLKQIAVWIPSAIFFVGGLINLSLYEIKLNFETFSLKYDNNNKTN